MPDPTELMNQSARLVDEALARAREELAQINQRKAELEAVIAQAEAVRRVQSPRATDPQDLTRGLTLHEAIAVILREEGNRWMSVREIAEAVNTRGLYHKKDGSPVEMNQIHARTKNYTHLFEKDGPKVRLHPNGGESR